MKRLVALMMCAVSLGATSQLTFEFVFQSDSTVFLISDGEVNYWSEAEDICQSFGGHLATFSSLEENLAVFDIVGAGPWIGLIQSPEGDEPNGGWSWVKSESLSYENWFANEPNEHHSGEDFGQLYADGGWNDIRNYDTDPHRVLMEVSLSLNLVGCTNTDACNFMEQATIDDGSCHFNCQFCQDGTVWDEEIQGCISANTADINNDGCVQLNDLLDLLSAYGDCGAEESPWQCGDPLEYQGYDYETVQIGVQCWFAENLRVEKFNNGDSIPFATDAGNWSILESALASTYGEGEISLCNNYSDYVEEFDACDESLSLGQFGLLYNWYATQDEREVCPSGWKIPSNQDWVNLEVAVEDSISGSIGQALMSTELWEGGPGTNALGWDGLPGGCRYSAGHFQWAGRVGYWWSSDNDGNNGYFRRLDYDSDELIQMSSEYGFNSNFGFSVRCLKNAE